MALLSLLQPSFLQSPVSSDCIFPGGRLGQASSALALMLASETMTQSQAMIDNISVAPSSSWYFSLTPFESIMLGLIVLKLMLLRYLTILPVDLHNFANKDYFDFGKKRRRRGSDEHGLGADFDDPKMRKEKERLAEIMFTVIRRLDMQDCFLRMLCELQAHSLKGKALPREVKWTLSALSKSGWRRQQEKHPDLGKDFIEERPILSVFEESVLTGWNATQLKSNTECMERYFLCPLTTEDIFSHFDVVKDLDVLGSTKVYKQS